MTVMLCAIAGLVVGLLFGYVDKVRYVRRHGRWDATPWFYWGVSSLWGIIGGLLVAAILLDEGISSRIIGGLFIFIWLGAWFTRDRYEPANGH